MRGVQVLGDWELGLNDGFLECLLALGLHELFDDRLVICFTAIVVGGLLLIAAQLVRVQVPFIFIENARWVNQVLYGKLFADFTGFCLQFLRGRADRIGFVERSDLIQCFLGLMLRRLRLLEDLFAALLEFLHLFVVLLLFTGTDLVFEVLLELLLCVHFLRHEAQLSLPDRRLQRA